MKCRECNFDEATEFIGPTGNRVKRGYCKWCLERLVSKCDWQTSGRLSRDEFITRSLNRRGTEEIGRRMLSLQSIGGSPIDSEEGEDDES